MILLTNIRHAYPEPAGFHMIRPHGHEDYTFLHFFNYMKFIINGEEITAPAGSFIIYRPGMPQEFISELPLVHNWAHFRGDISHILLENGLECDKLYTPSSSSFVTDIIQEMEMEFFSQKNGAAILINHKFEELMIKLGRAVSTSNETEFNDVIRSKFKTLRETLFATLHEDWSVERMANLTGYSTSRFNAIYKSIYGISPTADLINARINRAKNLLVLEDLSVEEISNALGYQNLTHFIRQFKRKVGCSPTMYRKNH